MSLLEYDNAFYRQLSANDMQQTMGGGNRPLAVNPTLFVDASTSIVFQNLHSQNARNVKKTILTPCLLITNVTRYYGGP